MPGIAVGRYSGHGGPRRADANTVGFASPEVGSAVRRDGWVPRQELRGSDVVLLFERITSVTSSDCMPATAVPCYAGHSRPRRREVLGGDMAAAQQENAETRRPDAAIRKRGHLDDSDGDSAADRLGELVKKDSGRGNSCLKTSVWSR